MAHYPDYKRTKIIACATVVEEILPHLPDGVDCEVLDFGLHQHPESLKDTLQRTIDNADEQIDTIVLGYGLCAMAVVGLKATRCTLVVPRLDDCIGIFMGSREAYQAQTELAPGTYYLTKGWIESNDTPLDEYYKLAEKYGPERADRMMQLMLKNYTRIVYIDTGHTDQEKYREYARKVAEQFHLEYEELAGSNALIEKMVTGDWNGGDFVVTKPGGQIRYADFKTSATSTSNLTLTYKADR